jgi:DNA-directed RNA polymerase specialized sigma24 family protein
MTPRPETNKRHALKIIERATHKLDDARESRDDALIAAHAHGLSLRELAAASGLGVETVRRTLHANNINTNGGDR